MATKFKDATPSSRVFVGTIGIGPATKNLARLNDPDKELMIKEMMGNVSALIQLIVGMVQPFGLVGKSEDVSMTRPNDMWN